MTRVLGNLLAAWAVWRRFRPKRRAPAGINFSTVADTNLYRPATRLRYACPCGHDFAPESLADSCPACRRPIIDPYRPGPNVLTSHGRLSWG